jgi:hypothetical protein
MGSGNLGFNSGCHIDHNPNPYPNHIVESGAKLHNPDT